MARGNAALILEIAFLSRNEFGLTVFGDELYKRAIGWTVYALGPVVEQSIEKRNHSISHATYNYATPEIYLDPIPVELYMLISHYWYSLTRMM